MGSQPLDDLNTLTRLLVASGLIGEAQFAKVWKGFESISTNEAKGKGEVATFCDYLIRKQIITGWQRNMLCKGRYKGFFFEQYKLMDHLGSDNQCMRYVAEELASRKSVVLVIEARPPGDVKFQYTVETYSP
ncbi:MAG TPA: hypothetical protein VMJ32_18575 [Pirellulales bacterium]|nr:hypothetical protein [Pirellulales bacterium]